MANLSQAQIQELLNTTLASIDKTAVEAYKRAHPLWDTLSKNFKSQRGGSSMELNVIFRSNNTPVFTDDASVSFIPSVTETKTDRAVYDFVSSHVGHVRLPYMLLEKNQGPEAMIDLMALSREQLTYEFQTSTIAALHAEHGSRGANAPLSLDSLCNDSVHEVGGIDWTLPGKSSWRPVTQDASGKTDPKRIVRELVDAILLNSNGVRPSVLLCGKNLWDMLREYLDDKGVVQSVGSTSAIEVDWSEIRFQGLSVRWDYDCPDDRAYALDPASLHFRYLNDKFFKAEEAIRVPEIVNGTLVQTLDFVHPVVSIISVGARSRRNLGLVTGIGE
jgi:hypothetical protein